MDKTETGHQKFLYNLHCSELQTKKECSHYKYLYRKSNQENKLWRTEVKELRKYLKTVEEKYEKLHRKWKLVHANSERA